MSSRNGVVRVALASDMEWLLQTLCMKVWQTLGHWLGIPDDSINPPVVVVHMGISITESFSSTRLWVTLETRIE